MSWPLTSPAEPLPVLNKPKTVYRSDPGVVPPLTSSKNRVMSLGAVVIGLNAMYRRAGTTEVVVVVAETTVTSPGPTGFLDSQPTSTAASRAPDAISGSSVRMDDRLKRSNPGRRRE